MINLNISQFKALLSKELKEAFRDKRAMMMCLTCSILSGVTS